MSFPPPSHTSTLKQPPCCRRRGNQYPRLILSEVLVPHARSPGTSCCQRGASTAAATARGVQGTPIEAVVTLTGPQHTVQEQVLLGIGKADTTFPFCSVINRELLQALTVHKETGKAAAREVAQLFFLLNDAAMGQGTEKRRESPSLGPQFI